MSTLVVYADTSDGFLSLELNAGSYSYTNVLTGTYTRTPVTDQDNLYFGSKFDYSDYNSYGVNESFLSFDTSSVGSSSTVTDAKLSLYYLFHDYLTTTYYAAAYDWGTSLESADWRTSPGSLTKLASKSGSWSTTSYTDWTTLTAFPPNVNKTGSTRMVLFDSYASTGTAPAQDDWFTLSVYSANYAGTTNDPKLTVTYTASGSTTYDDFFTGDAYVGTKTESSINASSTVQSTVALSFLANAEVYNTSTRIYSFVSDATIKKTTSAYFSGRGSVRRTFQNGPINSDAYVLRENSASYAANANVKSTLQSAFSADATIESGLVGAAAYTIGKPFFADAVVKAVTETTFSRLTILATPDTVSDTFLSTITAVKQVPIVRVDILDPISKTIIDTITDDVDDGTVTVDVSRGNRRTMQLRIVNTDGKYTPVNGATDSHSYFAFNSLVRVYRGFRYIDARGGETDEYCLLGTFLIDRPEVFVERNMSVLTVDGSDRWKVIASGGFPGPAKMFAATTNINYLIREVAILSGLSDDDLNLDQLEDRSTDLKTIKTRLGWEIGDSRADFLTNLCDQFGLDIFFDVAGNLMTRQTVDPTTTSPKWTFTPSEDGVMLGVTKIQSDLNLYNDIIVSGETSQGAFTGARYELADTAAANVSVTSIYGTMGRRTFHYRAPLVYSLSQAQVVAQKLYAEKCLVDEEIKLPTVCLPHLDGNDVIEIVEPTWSKVSDRYLAQRFDIPLREARQVIETKKGRAIS